MGMGISPAAPETTPLAPLWQCRRPSPPPPPLLPPSPPLLPPPPPLSPPPPLPLTRSSYRIGDAAPQLVDAIAVGGGDGDDRQAERAAELLQGRLALVLGQLVGLRHHCQDEHAARRQVFRDLRFVEAGVAARIDEQHQHLERRALRQILIDEGQPLLALRLRHLGVAVARQIDEVELAPIGGGTTALRGDHHTEGVDEGGGTRGGPKG